MNIIKLDERNIYRDSIYKYLDADFSQYMLSQYITSDNLNSDTLIKFMSENDIDLTPVMPDIKNSSTGVIFFLKEKILDIVIPSFEVTENFVHTSYDLGPLKNIFNQPRIVGVILLRLGRFALAVLDDEKIVASKTEGRYVKNRHKAGGSSQRRFERSRERLIREFYDKSCEQVEKVFEGHIKNIDHIFLGGEVHTLNGFKKRCSFINKYDQKVMTRILDINIPNQKTINSIARQVYSSKLITYELIQD